MHFDFDATKEATSPKEIDTIITGWKMHANLSVSDWGENSYTIHTFDPYKKPMDVTLNKVFWVSHLCGSNSSDPEHPKNYQLILGGYGPNNKVMQFSISFLGDKITEESFLGAHVVFC